MRITARQIEVFRMAYRLRSTRKAADALFVSQPAVSRIISELETEMGVVLFDRTGRKFEPTTAARSLHKTVRRHYQGLERIRYTAEQIASGTGGHLRVAAVPAVADARVAAAAGVLMAEYPSLRIDVDVLNEVAAISALRDGQVDCAVISSDPGDAGLACTRLPDIQPVVIMPKNDPMAEANEISATELVEVPQVMLPVDSPFRRAVDHMFDREGLSFIVRAEARTQSALVTMVAKGAGRAIVDKHVLSSASETRVSIVSLSTELNWPIRMIASSAAHDIPGLRRLLDKLTKSSGRLS